MVPKSGDEIREAFLQFYKGKGHKIISSSSLIPSDPTVLLTIAGMLPFKPIFLGIDEPPCKRATSSQKCIRTNDIENVGITSRHHTFFEMLGNFSFGDYFKVDAIKWSWELCINVFNLNPKNLIISVFEDDSESELIWLNDVGVQKDKIIKMGEKDNFWSAGNTGPCGPCSEIYYDFKPEQGYKHIDLDDDSRFIEFYNLVFMQYDRDIDGNLVALKEKYIDTGMGLERMARILQGVSNNYETDLIFPILKKTSSLLNLEYESIDTKKKISIKIIADHVRAITHLISDGVTSSNLGRGYILRRLIRRVVRHGKLIDIQGKFLEALVLTSINMMKSAYPNLVEKKELILHEVNVEESRFLETLERGERLLDEILSEGPEFITGKQAFELYDTYGFPLELTQEIALEKDLRVDIEGFNNEMEKQRNRAKSAALKFDLSTNIKIVNEIKKLSITNFYGYTKLAGKAKVIAIFIEGDQVISANEGQSIQLVLDSTPFYAESGGQKGDVGICIGDKFHLQVLDVKKEKKVFVHSVFINSGILNLGDNLECIVNSSERKKLNSNHTATHLLQSALKQLVNINIGQRGSLVAFDRLRFDFNSPKNITREQLIDIECLINQWIKEDHNILIKHMLKDDALKAGALAMFGEKYEDNVRVVDIPGVSMELCGGTHVESTSELINFKIISESGIASGIRRIEAISGPSLIDHLKLKSSILDQITLNLKSNPNQVLERIKSIESESSDLEKKVKNLKSQIVSLKVKDLLDKKHEVSNKTFIFSRVDNLDGMQLQSLSQNLIKKLGHNSGVIIGGLSEGSNSSKMIIVVSFAEGLVDLGLHAGKFIAPIAQSCGGRGGGRPNFAQAGGNNISALESSLLEAKNNLLAIL